MSVEKTTKNKIPYLYIAFVLVVLSCWGFYMTSTDSFFVFAKHWAAVLTMVFGAFIAGSSPEGSAAIAYPVLYTFTQNRAFGSSQFCICHSEHRHDISFFTNLRFKNKSRLGLH